MLTKDAGSASFTVSAVLRGLLVASLHTFSEAPELVIGSVSPTTKQHILKKHGCARTWGEADNTGVEACRHGIALLHG